jgi:hypothetical protein
MYLKHISPALSSFFLTYLEMQRRTGSLEPANACEKEKRAREEQEREKKTRVLTSFRWVFLKFFFFPLENFR